MKKALLLIGALVLVCPVLASAEVQFGLGAFGGMDVPIIQDDQASGTMFGFKARLKALPVIILEPTLHFSTYGEPDIEDLPNAGLDGSDVTFYGVDATLGAPFAPKFSFYGIGGIGIYNVKRDQTDQDESTFGWSAGLGIGIGLGTNLALDFRGKLHVIPQEDGGSKKSATVTGGLNYHFGPGGSK